MSKRRHNKERDNSWVWLLATVGVCFVLFTALLACGSLRKNSLAHNPSLAANNIDITAAEYHLPLFKSLIINPESEDNYFDFILDTGDRVFEDERQLEPEVRELINHFFLGITLPSDEFWVNLNFAQQDKIISPRLGLTDLGKTLLEADLKLKKDTAQLIDPRNPIGAKYWKILKEQLNNRGLTNTPIPSANRVWIVPDEIIVEENNHTVTIVKSSLRVSLESDYLKPNSNNSSQDKELLQCAKKAMKEAVLPALEYKVNYSEAYAPLRQIYNSLILSECFKHKYWGNKSFFSHTVNQGYLDGLKSKTQWNKKDYFNAYVQSVEKGEHSFYQTEFDPYQLDMVKKHYLSGGVNLGEIREDLTITLAAQEDKDPVSSPAAFRGIPLLIKPFSLEDPNQRRHSPFELREVKCAKLDQPNVSMMLAKAEISITASSPMQEDKGPENFLPVPRVRTSQENLYQKVIEMMYEETIAIYRRAKAFHQYTWQYQAEFAGELLNHPATFETGRGLLEESYAKGVDLGEGFDGDGWPVNQTYEIATVVITEMGRHPNLRERALELIFDSRTYGFQKNAEEAKDFEKTQELIKPERQLSTDRVEEKGLVKGFLNRFARMKPNLPAQKIKRSIHNPEILGKMIHLILCLAESIGDDDLELSNRLIDARIKLGTWYRESQEKRYRSEDIAHEVEKLKHYAGLLPKLTELAQFSSEKEDRDNAFLELADGYLQIGHMDKAFELFMKGDQVTYYTLNRVIAKIAANSKYRKEALQHIRKIGGEHIFVWLIAVGDELREQGRVKEARQLYRESWELSSKSSEHERNVASYFVRIARETNMKFGKLGTRQGLNDLLENTRKTVISQLENWDVSRDRNNKRFLSFAKDAIRELTIVGRYDEAEEIVKLVDKKYRIEYWGQEANHMRPEERDYCYKEMAIASAHRGDIERVEEYLAKMIEFKPETTLESLFEIGQIMLEQDIEKEKVGKIFAKAAEAGLGDFSLRRLVEITKKHKELFPYILDIMNNASKNNCSIVARHQYRVILGSMREFFPELVNFVPDFPEEIQEKSSSPIHDSDFGGIDLHKMKIKGSGK